MQEERELDLEESKIEFEGMDESKFSETINFDDTINQQEKSRFRQDETIYKSMLPAEN